MDYIEFLREKIDIAPETGFEVSEAEVNPALKPHQRDAVRWAVRGGRRALFEAFGLGKTVQELEFCRLVLDHKGGMALIVLPLEVRREFEHDAAQLLGMEPPRYIKHMAEADKPGIYITNYERVRDGDIDPNRFTATSLDEASVLRGYGTKTYQEFLLKFKGVEYKLVATATPAPNKYKELIHYAGYLEVMDTGQALTRFFKRDSTKANNLTIYPGKEEEFWLWVSSWALYINRPSDLGYSDEGYDLPPLEVRYHKLETDVSLTTDRDGQEHLYEEAAVGLTAAAKIKRESVERRVKAAVDIVRQEPGEHFILWHDLEAERREKEYLQIIGKYKKPEQEVFPKLLGATVEALEENPEQDFLGELFMGLDLGNHWKGQFFTPYNICKMMAEMIVGNAEAEIERKGWIGIEDCCCGGGAMLIGARNALARKKIDWTNQALFVAQDIDDTAAMMCYIQLSLLGCSGYVAVGNSLTNPVTGPSPLFPVARDGLDIWYTPTFYLDVWEYRRIWHSMDRLTQKAENGAKTASESEPILEHQEAPKTPEMAFATNENGQLTLF